MKRNNSCLNIGKHLRKLNLKEFYRITEKEKIFDESLGEEQKLTLKNTLFNKINKAVPSKNINTQQIKIFIFRLKFYINNYLLLPL